MRGLSVEEASTENTVCSLHGPCVAVCFKRKDGSVDDELCAPCGDDDSSDEDDCTLPNGKFITNIAISIMEYSNIKFL